MRISHKAAAQKKTTFAAVLKKRAKNISFHTPGHNNNLPKCLTRLDTTELAYSGNLLESQGVIKDLENKISKIYNVQSAFISTNGATACILTAVCALKAYGGFLICAEAHTSVFNAVRIVDATAFECGALPVQPPKGVATLVVTYPDYFGRCIDLAAAREYAAKHNLFLLVDSAHGSHFAFSPKLPLSATLFGDLVVCSLHKTLPVCTGGAALLCNKEELADTIMLCRKLFHSTSPSYMTLASIDGATDLFAKKGRMLYDRVYAALRKFSKADIGFFEIEKNHDFTRLVLKSKYTADEVSAALTKRGIDMEMSSQNKIVAIVTPFNYKKLPKLRKALKRINSLGLYQMSERAEIKNNGAVRLLKIDAQFELVSLDAAVGRKAYCDMGIYPPGTPIIKAGDSISTEAAETLMKNPLNSFGLVNGRAAVLLYKDGGL